MPSTAFFFPAQDSSLCSSLSCFCMRVIFLSSDIHSCSHVKKNSLLPLPCPGVLSLHEAISAHNSMSSSSLHMSLLQEGNYFLFSLRTLPTQFSLNSLLVPLHSISSSRSHHERDCIHVVARSSIIIKSSPCFIQWGNKIRTRGKKRFSSFLAVSVELGPFCKQPNKPLIINMRTTVWSRKRYIPTPLLFVTWRKIEMGWILRFSSRFSVLLLCFMCALRR